MEIYLIRHGECESLKPECFNEEKQTMDPPLTQMGVKQAEQMAKYLHTVSFDAIYSSDLERAVRTAEALSKQVDRPVIQNSALREIEMGELFWHSWEEYPEIYEKWKNHDEDIAYPGGENGQMVWNRCETFLHEIITKDFTRVAIVCHGGIIRSIIAGALNIPQQKRFLFGSPIKNCSVSILNYQEGMFSIHRLNENTWRQK